MPCFILKFVETQCSEQGIVVSIPQSDIDMKFPQEASRTLLPIFVIQFYFSVFAWNVYRYFCKVTSYTWPISAMDQNWERWFDLVTKKFPGFAACRGRNWTQQSRCFVPTWIFWSQSWWVGLLCREAWVLMLFECDIFPWTAWLCFHRNIGLPGS